MNNSGSGFVATNPKRPVSGKNPDTNNISPTFRNTPPERKMPEKGMGLGRQEVK